ncbi:hypothetical protein HDV05_006692 [Chytridiales sp. JEL 0842]|nr:hypothetical protein HDV05_006692 [Chytridiales sp. JEL 0842]
MFPAQEQDGDESTSDLFSGAFESLKSLLYQNTQNSKDGMWAAVNDIFVSTERDEQEAPSSKPKAASKGMWEFFAESVADAFVGTTQRVDSPSQVKTSTTVSQQKQQTPVTAAPAAETQQPYITPPPRTFKQRSQQKLVNLSFNQGLHGWTLARQPGSQQCSPRVLSEGKAGPCSGLVPPPQTLYKSNNAKAKYLLFDVHTPGSFAVYQSFTPQEGDVLSFKWMVANYASSGYHIPEGGFMGASHSHANQQFRVDLMDASIHPSVLFRNPRQASSSLKAGNEGVLANVLSPWKVEGIMTALRGPPFVDTLPWQTTQFDLGAWVGREIMIAFRVVGNQGVLQVGVDEVMVSNRKINGPGEQGIVDGVGRDEGVEVEAGEEC